MLMPIASRSWLGALVLRVPLSAGKSMRLSLRQLVFWVTVPQAGTLCGQSWPGPAPQTGVSSDVAPPQRD